MNNSKIERLAVYETALVFTRFGWFFKEQPILDIGIDAIVETSINEAKKINLFALQIKGGESNFYRTKNYLVFYLSDRHYEYWSAVSEIYPVLIILYDPSTRKIYWEHFNKKKVTLANKTWKIQIPIENILNELSKSKIESILTALPKVPSSKIPNYKQNSDRLKPQFNYFISDEKKGQLHLLISNDRKFGLVNLKYSPPKRSWNKISKELAMEDPFYFTLKDFEAFIQTRFLELKTSKTKNFFDIVLQEVSRFSECGIKKIAEFIFNFNNKKFDIQDFNSFLKAFEHYTQLRPSQYQVVAIGKNLIFKTKDKSFEIETYESLTAKLNEYITDKFYDEIYLNTDEYIWNEVFLNSDIKKHEFIPRMLNEWEGYWGSIYQEIKNELGHTHHLDKHKDISFKKLEKLFELYNETDNIIQLAYELDELELFPLAVTAMVNISDSESCFNEYCNMEFSKSDIWTDIYLAEDDNDWESPGFYIKLKEL